VLYGEVERAIESALGELPYEQRVAFTLSYFENTSTRDIAEILETSVKSVEMHIYRARNCLRDRLRHFLE